MKNDHLLTKFLNKANWSRQVHKLILGPEALGYWSFDKEKSVKGEKYQESKKELFALEKKIINWYAEEKKNRKGKGGKYLDKENIFSWKRWWRGKSKKIFGEILWRRQGTGNKKEENNTTFS